MADTTSINDLPVNPAGGASGNVHFSANETSTFVNNQQQQAQGIDQNTMNQIVSGLQQASTTGVTTLPSRDIPQNTQTYVQDPQIQANYIPQGSNVDYIKDYEDNYDIIDNYNKNLKSSNSLDKLYDEIQIPLLIGILFFLFQLPAFKKLLHTYFPILLFHKDGNVNIYGYLLQSILFGLIYYILYKITVHFNKF